MSWYKIIKNKSEGPDTIEMFGEIGWEVTASQFSAELKALNDNDIIIKLNSPGGSIFEGIALFEIIKNYKGHVTVEIMGLAASMGSVIPMAADKVIMGDMSVMMVHNPWTIAGGEAEDFRKAADTLDKLKGVLVNAYVSKTGLSEDEISAMMDAETWMTAEEALEKGFIDEIAEDLAIAACLSDKITIPERFNNLKPFNKIESKGMRTNLASAKLRLASI